MTYSTHEKERHRAELSLALPLLSPSTTLHIIVISPFPHHTSKGLVKFIDNLKLKNYRHAGVPISQTRDSFSQESLGSEIGTGLSRGLGLCNAPFTFHRGHG